MYLVFFLIWIIFNGNFTIEIAAIGLVISGLMYLFICRFLGYQPKNDLLFCKKFFLILEYVFVLLTEIIKANFAVIRMVMSFQYEIEPAVVQFRADLSTKMGRVLLANSITLTPGTITVSLEGNEYIVHCLDKELAKGIDSSLFVELIQKLERTD